MRPDFDSPRIPQLPEARWNPGAAKAVLVQNVSSRLSARTTLL